MYAGELCFLIFYGNVPLVNVNKRKIGLCVIYKQPSINVNCLDEFFNVLEGIYNEVDFIIIVGDININLLRENNETNYFKNILYNFKLNQIVKDYTRITNETKSLIDVICISEYMKIKSCENIEMYDVTYDGIMKCLNRWMSTR